MELYLGIMMYRSDYAVFIIKKIYKYQSQQQSENIVEQNYKARYK